MLGDFERKICWRSKHLLHFLLICVKPSESWKRENGILLVGCFDFGKHDSSEKRMPIITYSLHRLVVTIKLTRMPIITHSVHYLVVTLKLTTMPLGSELHRKHNWIDLERSVDFMIGHVIRSKEFVTHDTVWVAPISKCITFFSGQHLSHMEAAPSKRMGVQTWHLCHHYSYFLKMQILILRYVEM